jgi:hypothetical protein
MDFDKIFQESEMTQEEKMDAWHNGTRGFNIKAASTSKLRGNLAICKKKKYKSEVAAIEAELKSRGLKIKESVEDTNEVEAPEEHTAETETTSNPLWKVEALGDDEVRELFNNIRNGDNGLDKQFVEKIYEIFPDMPHAVRILRGGSVDESGDWDKFTFEEGRLFEDSLVYYENERKSGVCEYQNLFDYIGDGKNPFEIYVATYSHSDGMEDTVILYYGDDWYMVCPWDEEKIKDALMDFITDVEDGTKVLKRCYHKEFNQSLTSSNKSIF